MKSAKWVSALALVAASSAPGLLAVAPAWADSGVSSVLASNWYWQEQDNVTPPGAPGGLPVGAPSETSGIPAGDLGVSYQTQVDKVAALNFDVSSLVPGSTVSKFTVTTPVDTAANNIANDVPHLAACPAIDAFKPGTGPSPFSEVPPQGTSVCVDAKYDTGKSAYTFDITQIANDWAQGAPVNGIVIQPKLGDATPFNYALKGAKDIRVTLDIVAPAAPVAPVAPPADSGSGFVAAPPSSFDSGTTATAPLTSVDAPPLTAPAPAVMPAAAPVVAAPQAAPAAAVRPLGESLRPNGAFWLALLGLAALLLLAGLVLGDPLEPVAADPRRRRFADVIRARSATRASASDAVRPSLPRARAV